MNNLEKEPNILGNVEKEKEGGEEQEREPVYAKEEWFEAELEGNLRVPQTYLGIGAFLTEALLRDESPDFDGFLESKLSEEQLARFRNAMNSAHKSRNIPVGSRDEIKSILRSITEQRGGEEPPFRLSVSDKMLHEIWGEAKASVLHGILNILNNLPETSESDVINHDAEDGFTQLKERLRADSTRAGVHKAAQEAVDAFRSEEGRELAEKYRSFFQFKNREYPSGRTGVKRREEADAEVEHVRYELREFVLRNIRRNNPGLAENLEHYPW